MIAATIPDGYVVAFLSATASVVTLVGAWFFSRIGNHEKQLAVKEREDEIRDKQIEDMNRRLDILEGRPR